MTAPAISELVPTLCSSAVEAVEMEKSPMEHRVSENVFVSWRIEATATRMSSRY